MSRRAILALPSRARGVPQTPVIHAGGMLVLRFAHLLRDEFAPSNMKRR
jgi:hypothetical protein